MTIMSKIGAKDSKSPAGLEALELPPLATVLVVESEETPAATGPADAPVSPVLFMILPYIPF
jgi:hypothetical protein